MNQLPMPITRVWMIAPDALAALYQKSANAAGRTGAQFTSPKPTAARGSTVALIDIVGLMLKYQEDFPRWETGEAAATFDLAQRVRDAASNDSIDLIILFIDSPGGSTAGTQDLADAVYEARQKKPVTAYISDTGCSAAYWVASQASKIYANPMAVVGSIGTYAVVVDISQSLAAAGIKVHLIGTGGVKGCGELGTEVTAEHLAEWQKTINSFNAQFIQGVARGRKFPPDRVRGLADGRVYVGAEAQRIGLIDGIASFDQIIHQAVEVAKSAADLRAMAAKAAADKAAFAALSPYEQAYMKQHGTLPPPEPEKPYSKPWHAMR